MVAQIAAKWYEKASIQGHQSAKFNLALHYADGKGVERDLDKARNLLRQAAKGADESTAANARRVLKELGN